MIHKESGAIVLVCVMSRGKEGGPERGEGKEVEKQKDVVMKKYPCSSQGPT